MRLVKKRIEIVIDKSNNPDNEARTTKEIIEDEITIADENSPTLKEVYKLLKSILVYLAGYKVEQ